MLCAFPQSDTLTVSLLARSTLPVKTGVQPVTFGVPFPKGRLREPFVGVLETPLGETVQVQTAPLSRWSDDSIKWLLLDGVLPALPAGDSKLQLRLERFLPDWKGYAQVRIAECDKEGVVVDTGSARFELDAKLLLPLRKMYCDGAAWPHAPATELLLTDARGRVWRPRIHNVEVETAGPVRTTVLVTGDFGKGRWLRFQSRISFFGGTGLVRVALTVHNPHRARHRGGLWDLGDPGSILFRDFSLKVNVPVDPQSQVRWKAEMGFPIRSLLSADRLELYQDSSGGRNWNSRNHINREGRVPCRFRGYRVVTSEGEEYGLRATPIVEARYGGISIAAAVSDFWQQFPKALERDEQGIWLRLFPHQWDDVHELQGGERKTHRLWLQFGATDRAPALEWVYAPVRICCTPEWYAQSGVVPYLLPADADSDGRLRELMEESLYGPQSIFEKREVIDEYGWRNYGDVWADHEEAYYDGPRPVISHFNNQHDMLDGATVQLFRTGDLTWYEIVEPLARHVVDIDIYHTTEDKAAYNGGFFWHSDHYKDAGTSTHRTYSKWNVPADRQSYGGGPANEHLYTTGLLRCYYLTGDQEFRAAVLGLADWVLRMDDGSLTVLSLVDDGPTGLASQTAGAEYHGPGRGAGNAINALLDAWELSEADRYLRKAEELIRRCIHPDDDVPARNLLDSERRWSYTVFLSAIARYLDMKAERGQHDWHYAYAQHALVHYGRWMAENERPYLDRPEELEYPTETWAAQELRKANVLRYAARHVDSESAQLLLARAAQLADRAWEELLRFPTRYYTRPIAIVMREGAWDAWFRSVSDIRPYKPTVKGDFGTPAMFVTQKQRVLRLLKTPSGWAKTALLIFRPKNVGWLYKHLLCRLLQ